jgi:hypothetical protein
MGSDGWGQVFYFGVLQSGSLLKKTFKNTKIKDLFECISKGQLEEKETSCGRIA